MAWKSILKPEGSTMAGLATVGAVYGLYQLNVGSVASAQATDPNHPVLASARKKAGYASLVLVASLGLITRDGNLMILGAGTIVLMELSYRHAIMAHPASGVMQPPDASAYVPAGDATPDNVVSINDGSYYDDMAG